MKASELFAISQNSKCEGNKECYWCGAPCGEGHTHSEPMPRVIAQKNLQVSRPASPWICEGCFLFRRPSISIFDLNRKWVKDRQTCPKWSILITERETLGITLAAKDSLQKFLLSPSQRFCLMILNRANIENRLHHAIVNDVRQVLEGTEFHFTVDNVPHSWSVASLRHGINNEPNGTEAGVRFFLENFGPWTPDPKEEPRGPGKRKVEDAKVLLKPVK